MAIEAVLERYGRLLAEVDGWFAGCAEIFPEEIACRSGCSECCRGLFDVTLLDAWYLRTGFERLPMEVRRGVREKAEERLVSLRGVWPELSPPFILNLHAEEEWDDLMPDDDETPCVFLGDDGRCLVYAYRPMTCRLHGIPLVDQSGAYFMEEWCSNNFRDVMPLERVELRWHFFSCFQRELGLFREITGELFGMAINELDTLIPLCVLTDYRSFEWRRWGREKLAAIR